MRSKAVIKDEAGVYVQKITRDQMRVDELLVLTATKLGKKTTSRSVLHDNKKRVLVDDTDIHDVLKDSRVYNVNDANTLKDNQ